MAIYAAGLTLAVIGYILGGCFFFAPTPTITNVIRNRSVGERTPIPYLAALGTCLVWIIYGAPFINPFGTPTMIVNGIGAATMTTYLGIFYFFSGQPKQRLVIIVVLVVEVVSVAILTTTTLTLIPERSLRRLVVTFSCCVCSIILYISPIPTMVKVVRTKSVEHMSILEALAMFATAMVWTVYWLLPLNHLMLITFGLCTLLGLVQVIVYGMYYRSIQRILAARRLQPAIVV